MVVMAILIRCPMCKKEFGSLAFWKKVEHRSYHLCLKCRNDQKDEADLLEIGFQAGYELAREEVRRYVS